VILTATTVVLPVFFVLALGYFAGRANQFREDKNAWQFTISEERAIHMSRELRTRNKERVI